VKKNNNKICEEEEESVKSKNKKICEEEEEKEEEF